MEKEYLFRLGIEAQNGNELAFIKIIERKRKLIKKMSYGDEDRYQYIILKLIEGIKKYKF